MATLPLTLQKLKKLNIKDTFSLPSDLNTICRDFLKTPQTCNRGHSCKFVHLNWIKRPSPDGAPFCINDIFGKCDRGLRCNFFHIRIDKTPSMDPLSLASDGRQHCIDFNRGRCKKGDRCRFHHARVEKFASLSYAWPPLAVPQINPWTNKVATGKVTTGKVATGKVTAGKVTTGKVTTGKARGVSRYASSLWDIAEGISDDGDRSGMEGDDSDDLTCARAFERTRAVQTAGLRHEADELLSRLHNHQISTVEYNTAAEFLLRTHKVPPATTRKVRDFRVVNLQSFLRSSQMDNDEVFTGKNSYLTPIRTPIDKEIVDKDVENKLREPFSLFKHDPFILWRMVDGSVGALPPRQALQFSPVAIRREE